MRNNLFVIMIFIFAFSLLYFVSNNFISQAANLNYALPKNSLIGSTSNPWYFMLMPPRHLLYDSKHDYWWVFWSDSPGRLVYSYSEDGATWSSPILFYDKFAGFDSYLGVHSVWHEGESVFVAWPTNDALKILFRRGILGEGKIEWDPIKTVYDISSQVGPNNDLRIYSPYVTTDSEGKPWLSFNWFNGTSFYGIWNFGKTELKNGKIFVMKAQDRDGKNWETPVMIRDWFYPSLVSIENIGNKKMLASIWYWDLDASVFGRYPLEDPRSWKIGFSYSIFKNGAWEQTKDLSIIPNHYRSMHSDLNTVRDSKGNVYMVYIDENGGGLSYTYFNSSSETWNTNAESLDKTVIQSYGISIDKDDKLYVFYQNSGKINLKTKEPGKSWSEKSFPFGTSFQGLYILTPQYSAVDDKIGVMWQEWTGSIWNTMFNFISPGGGICGNGVVDKNEECDPPLSIISCTVGGKAGVKTCGSDCKFLNEGKCVEATDKPELSNFKFSGSPQYFNVFWNASYSTLPRKLEVQCYLNCDPKNEDCSKAQKCEPFPYSQFPGAGACTIENPKYLSGQDNKVGCRVYDPLNSALENFY